MAITREQHAQAVRELAEYCGWRRLSIEVFVRPPRLVHAAMLAQAEELSIAEQRSLALLAQCNLEVYAWRPADEREITEILQRRPQ